MRGRVRVVRSGNATAVRSAVQLEHSSLSMAWDRFAIERVECVCGCLGIWELHEAVADWRALDLVLDQLDMLDRSEPFELGGDVVLVHPGLHISNPQGARLHVDVVALVLVMPTSSVRVVLSTTVVSMMHVFHWFKCFKSY